MTPTDAGGLRVLPKLNKPQMARLVEVGLNEGQLAALADRQPRTTEALIGLGILERYQWRTMKFVRPTGLGVRVLAGYPGPDFDRFRALIAKES